MKKDKVFIIAEAGVNHNGNIDLAYEMIDKAVEAKVDAIKFQTFKAEKIISKYAPKAEYQKNNMKSNKSQLEMVKDLELSYKQFMDLKKYCYDKGIIFLTTPFDFESIDFVANDLNLDIIKIPSGEINNIPYLKKISVLKKKIIISTGMSTLSEINYALNILKDGGTKEIVVLHCNTEYPTPIQDVNLRAMLTIKETFNVPVGYSDHTLGIDVPVAAVAMGATVIEKHFTIDKLLEGPDHKASLEPSELKEMVEKIRTMEIVLGNGIKQPSESEIKNISIARKSIVARTHIKKGEILTEDNITIKRPGSGISPMKYYDVIGSVAIKEFEEDELIVI